jgi:hypothetical protein
MGKHNAIAICRLDGSQSQGQAPARIDRDRGEAAGHAIGSGADGAVVEKSFSEFFSAAMLRKIK